MRHPGTLIHYGHTEYIPERVGKIVNRQWIKPYGGLWTSPINSEWGWKDWCTSEGVRHIDKVNSFKLELNKEARIYIIDSLIDLIRLPLIHHPFLPSMRFIDFESVSKSHDVIWLTQRGESTTRYSEPNLYGWDVESVFIMNPNCCKQIDIKTPQTK
jgi:hypothetical protein